jgi:hypothetical protein
MKNKIIIEGKEFDLPDELVNRIKEELREPKKFSYSDILCKLEEQAGEENTFSMGLEDCCFSENQCKKITAINKLMNVAKYLNGEWKRNNIEEWRSSVYIDENNKVGTSDVFAKSVRSTVYFKTRELAQQAISILGEDTIRLALSTDW